MDTKGNLKLLVSSIFTVLVFSILQVVQGMEDSPKFIEPQKRSAIQLSKGVGDTLEAVLGTGNGIMLKLSMDLDIFKKPVEEERLEKGKLEVPIRLFLTDFISSPTIHSPIQLTAKVDCESSPPTCTLPNKPQSFQSQQAFIKWLKQGYFTNQVNITYDFQVDVQRCAPSLAQHLFNVVPEGYHFIGTHSLDNGAIKPDQCVPQVTYVSKRSNMNITIVTLGGILYLNKTPYSIDNHQQVFPHPMINQVIFKKDVTKKFYHHQWLAESEITAKVTYKEFSDYMIKEWPKAPCETYSVAQKKPEDKQKIEHLSCLDGNGEELDIKDDKIFLIISDAISNGAAIPIFERIVKDVEEKLYIVKYRNLEQEAKTLAELEEKIWNLLTTVESTHRDRYYWEEKEKRKTERDPYIKFKTSCYISERTWEHDPNRCTGCIYQNYNKEIHKQYQAVSPYLSTYTAITGNDYPHPFSRGGAPLEWKGEYTPRPRRPNDPIRREFRVIAEDDY